MSVAEAQEKISLREFLYWQAMYLIEPFGDHAGYIQSAQAQASLFNVNRRKGSSPINIGDCIIRFEPFKKATTQEKLFAKIEEMSRRVNKNFNLDKEGNPINGE